LNAYLSVVTNTPSPLGGIASDHIGSRQLLSYASALQRQDPACWIPLPEIYATLDTTRPFQCRTKVIQADPRYGPGLLEGHELRLAKTNPDAEIVRYVGSSHAPHRMLAFEERFFSDVDAFVSQVVSRQ